MSKYTIKTIDGNRYENIKNNDGMSIGEQLFWDRKWITIDDMDGCTRHFNAHNIVYIKEEDDGKETEEG